MLVRVMRLSFQPVRLEHAAAFDLVGRQEVAGSLTRAVHSQAFAIALVAVGTEHGEFPPGIGTVGIGVALIFLIFGAPDVAVTQLMVESLSAVLFGIALLRLPGLTERRSRSRRAFHWLIAGAVGVSVTLILLAITAHPPDRQLATYFEENAFSLAHGLNIVNVILVDFRAFDTFGELSVVLLAGIGAWALLKRRIGRARG